MGGVADRFDQVEGLGRVGVRFEDRLDQDPRLALGDRAGDAFDAVDPATALRTAGTSARSGTMMLVSAVVPEGKLLSSRCCPSVESTSVR